MADKESGKVIKSVGFNYNNPEEAKMLKAFKRRRNFSRYVKGLIAADLARKEAEKKAEKEKSPEPPRNPVQVEPVIEESSEVSYHPQQPTPQYPNNPTSPLLFPNQTKA